MKPQDTIKRAAKVLSMGIVCLGFLFLASDIFAASLKKVTGTPGTQGYDSAVNQNFERLNNELSNTVHKTSTETVHGHKYFDNLSTTNDLYINKTSGKLILKSPDGSCSSCGPDNADVWSCAGVTCP